MTFNEIIHLLLENSEIEPESMIEWLEDNEGDITLEKFKNFIEKYKVKYSHLIKNRIISVSDNTATVYLEYDRNYDDFDIIAWDKENLEHYV
jgi:hypothetical protein